MPRSYHRPADIATTWQVADVHEVQLCITQAVAVTESLFDSITASSWDVARAQAAELYALLERAEGYSILALGTSSAPEVLTEMETMLTTVTAGRELARSFSSMIPPAPQDDEQWLIGYLPAEQSQARLALIDYLSAEDPN